jgi:hypothetical protein
MQSGLEFLEKLGRDPRLPLLTPEKLAQLLGDADVEPSVRNALMNADYRGLETLLGATPAICCMVHAPEDDDEDTDHDGDDEPGQAEDDEERQDK